MSLKPPPCKPQAEACDRHLVTAMLMEESRHCCAQDGLIPCGLVRSILLSMGSVRAGVVRAQIPKYMFFFLFPLTQPGMRPKT